MFRQKVFNIEPATSYLHFIVLMLNNYYTSHKNESRPKGLDLFRIHQYLQVAG